MIASSVGEKGRCCTEGLSWLHHRKRQDLPERPGMPVLMRDQLRGPCSSTSLIRVASSCGVHEPFMLSLPVIPI